MTIVIDANILVVLVSSEHRREAVREQIREWTDAGEDLHAPALLPYEVASGLTRLVSAGDMSVDQMRSAWATIEKVPVRYHALQVGGEAVVSIALQLQRSSAYDAAYLALAQDLDAELWTLDGPLARNASSLGFPVHLL